MAKNVNDSVYNVIFNERDAEILELERIKAELEADVEEAVSEFIKISGKRKLKRKKKKLCSLLLDGNDPDKIK